MITFLSKFNPIAFIIWSYSLQSKETERKKAEKGGGSKDGAEAFARSRVIIRVPVLVICYVAALAEFDGGQVVRDHPKVQTCEACENGAEKKGDQELHKHHVHVRVGELTVQTNYICIRKHKNEFLPIGKGNKKKGQGGVEEEEKEVLVVSEAHAVGYGCMWNTDPRTVVVHP